MADVASLPEAIGRLVHDGDTVALKGFIHLACSNQILARANSP